MVNTNHKPQPVVSTLDIIIIAHGGVECPARMSLAMIIVGERERTGNTSLAMFRGGFQEKGKWKVNKHDMKKGIC